MLNLYLAGLIAVLVALVVSYTVTLETSARGGLTFWRIRTVRRVLLGGSFYIPRKGVQSCK
jgi:hypothetical protein